MREQDKEVNSDNRDWVPPRLKAAAGQHGDIRETRRAMAAGENPESAGELLQKEPDGASRQPPPAPATRCVVVPAFKTR